MTYEEFLKFVPAKCIYETIYEDTEGRPILVISLLDAYGMVNKAQRPWVGLTDEEIDDIFEINSANLTGGEYDGDEVMYDKGFENAVATIEAKLKQKNT